MPPTAPQANHVAMIPLSLLVTAPDGAAPCLLPQEIYTAADGTNLELIIADGSNPAVDLSRPGLKHVRLATTDVYALMHAGMRAAAMPWVVVIEDHCRPLPDFLDAYRRAIAENPHADAVAGTLENLTTVDPWSFASFLLISWRHWPPTGDWAGLPSTANFALRKAALSDEELARPGGIVIAGFSRLAAAGRTVRCIRPRSIMSASCRLSSASVWCIAPASAAGYCRATISRRVPCPSSSRVMSCASSIFACCGRSPPCFTCATRRSSA